MIEKTVARILTQKKLTLALAESCTGGLVADSLTNIPGSSKYFILGIVAYSNETKIRLLNVPREALVQHGAVSKEIALLLAQNVKRLGQADVGLGITGIAGPGGASSSKPVGIIFIAVSLGHHNYFKKFKFSGTRLKIKRLAKDSALALLLECL